MELPTHCFDCGAVLQASWTEHKPGCIIPTLIQDSMAASMTDWERALRLGIYAGLAAVKLQDQSYAERFLDRNIADVSAAEYAAFTCEVHRKLVDAGIIQADEDPFEEMYRELVKHLGEVPVSEFLKREKEV